MSPETSSLVLLTGDRAEVVRLLEAGPTPVVLVTVDHRVFVVELFDAALDDAEAHAWVSELLGTGGVDGVTATVVERRRGGCEVVDADGTRRDLDPVESTAMRRYGAAVSPAAVRIAITPASWEDVVSAVNVTRTTVWALTLPDGRTLLAVEPISGLAPDEEACALLALTLTSRKRRTLELWRDVDVQGAFAWDRKGMDSALVWGREEELVLPASIPPEERGDTSIPEGPLVSALASAASAPNASVDEVALRALHRRRDLEPDEVTSRLVTVLGLPDPVADVLSGRVAVRAVPGAVRVEGAGLKAELARVWDEPLPDSMPWWVRLAETRPAWYRVLNGVVAVLLFVRAWYVWTHDAAVWQRVLGIVFGVVGLFAAEVALRPGRDPSSSRTPAPPEPLAPHEESS